jgi:hypothetical protein
MTREELVDKIRRADENSDTTFAEIIREALGGGYVTPRMIADGLSVSYPTIRRWSEGLNAPAIPMRAAIYSWLIEQISAQKQ